MEDAPRASSLRPLRVGRRGALGGFRAVHVAFAVFACSLHLVDLQSSSIADRRSSGRGGPSVSPGPPSVSPAASLRALAALAALAVPPAGRWAPPFSFRAALASAMRWTPAGPGIPAILFEARRLLSPLGAVGPLGPLGAFRPLGAFGPLGAFRPPRLPRPPLSAVVPWRRTSLPAAHELAGSTAPRALLEGRDSPGPQRKREEAARAPAFDASCLLLLAVLAGGSMLRLSAATPPSDRDVPPAHPLQGRVAQLTEKVARATAQLWTAHREKDLLQAECWKLEAVLQDCQRQLALLEDEDYTLSQ